MFDYEIMRLIWWALLGILLIGFAVMDGFDLGVATLLPVVARTDIERRIVINTIGPVWEGNQVWLILGGGAIFAAWPILYATAFSGFYLAMFIVLAALIVRPVAIKFRSKIENTRWRATWDSAIAVSGLVPALIFGVAFGNVILGVPFKFDDTMRMTYEGNLFGLLNPFALLSGLISVAMLTLHGASYLALKASGAIVPLLKMVTRQTGAWLTNYGTFPWILAAPIVAVAALSITPFLLAARRAGAAFIASGAGVAAIIATAGLSIFPFMLPSSLEPGASLTVWDASSSHFTLKIMLFVTAAFLPLILLYTAWVYRVLRGPVTAAYVEGNIHSVY
jgi:cytochrome bd ubiquinol oxidase subunit II